MRLFGLSLLASSLGLPQSPAGLVLVALLLAHNLVVSAEPSRTTLREERFNADPTWDGRNNRSTPKEPPIVIQDFGYSATSHAGGEPGEIGGRVWQSVRGGYYGKEIEPKSLQNSLSASGSVAVLKAKSISGWHTTGDIFVGWFAADERDRIWRPRNFLGFRLQSSNEPDGCLVEICYGTAAWQAGGVFVNARGGGQEKLVRDLKTSDLLRIPPDGSRHFWSVTYEPADGEIVVQFDGGETRVTIPAEHRKAGARFDHFGIFTPRIPGLDIIAYFDDIMIDGEKHDFSTDPKWDGVGNRERYPDPAQYAYNNFGYSQTKFAGGAPGEIGGIFFSCNPSEEEFKAHYGDRIGQLTLEHRLVARGKFAAKEFSTDSSFALGWFNSKKQGYPLENFVGVYFDSLSSVGRIVQPLYGTREGNERQSAPHVTFNPDGTSYEWQLEYDPRAADGKGAITFRMNNQSTTLALAAGDREKGALMERFGLFNMQHANSKWCEVYFDDLSYTVESER